MVPDGMARRTCNPDTAEWDPVSLDECFTSKFILSNHKLLAICKLSSHSISSYCD